jgi:hypothetical protein
MNKPIFAKIDIPSQTLLLYENMVVNDLDRSENWRFLFRQDGCFFNARNTQLWVTDTSLLDSDDPALYWNTPFSSTPSRCLTQEQQAELLEAIRKTNFASLAKYYSASPDQQRSHPFVERWTVVQDSGAFTVVVENSAAPPPLVRLRTTIDKLVANAPRTK